MAGHRLHRLVTLAPLAWTVVLFVVLGHTASARADDFDTRGNSRDGLYSFDLGPSSSRWEPVRVTVWKRGKRHPYARFKIDGRNLVARFVANDNILASSGCGTDCSIAELLTPEGRRLAQLVNPIVSPDGTKALDVDIQDLGSGDSMVRVIDLRIGKRYDAVTVPGFWTCADGAEWRRTHVRFRCSDDREIRIRLK